MTTTRTAESFSITVTPATGVTVRSTGAGGVESIRARWFVALTGAEAERTFSSTDTDGKVSTYRLAQITIYTDGSIWAWAEQLTKQGRPFKNGMGLTMGGSNAMAKFYGQDVATVAADAVAMAVARDADHAEALETEARNLGYASVTDYLSAPGRFVQMVGRGQRPVAESLVNASAASLPFVNVTHARGDWTLTTEATLTDQQAGQLTFQAARSQVNMGAYVQVVDAGGTRIGHLASATYHRGSYFGPDYVMCTIELT
jgi:hypothetical protein